MSESPPTEPFDPSLAKTSPIEHNYPPLQTFEEELTSTSPMQALSKESIERFFAAKWRNRRCEVCEVTETWRVPADESRLMVSGALTKDEPISVLSEAYYVALVIYCENCGNMKLLNAETIVDWLSNEAS